ncbi:MAG: DegT/DnrJ/EryC1/StrS family aminotransferase [Chloroflexota bacterium]
MTATRPDAPVNPPVRNIPLAQPWVGDRERELVTQALDSGVLGLGPFARAFEERIAEMSGRRFGVSCSSGTAALHMAVRALGIGAGDEVITTPFSFVASTNCFLYEGARPVFVDIEEDSMGLDPSLLEAAATPRTKAVLPVQVFGRPCHIVEVADIAERHGWRLIEDSCEALGSSLDGRPLGSFGDASAFAFYPNKQITTGEGGVVVTDDPDLAAQFRSMRNQGRGEDGAWLQHVRLGYNYRMDELSAAVGVAQLERFEQLRSARAAVAAAYQRELGGIDWLRLPQAGPGESVDWFVYVIRLDRALDRNRMLADLEELGVQTRPYFSPIHTQRFMLELTDYREGDFPVTERVAASTLAIPWSPRMTDDDVAVVAAALRQAARRQGV